MATNATSKIDAAAEKAYAEAAAKKSVSEKAVEKAVEADAPKPAPKVAAVKKAVAAPAAKKAPVKKAPAKKAPVKKAPATKVVAKKAAPKKVAVKKAAPKKAAPEKTAAKKAPVKKAAKPAADTNPVIKLKDNIMATAKNTDFAATAKEVAADVQERAKTAFAKTSEFASDANEFNKANVEAVVESGKIFFAGAQDMAREQVETGKTVIETVTDDAKKMAAVKSPTELMQLQGEFARRNFDAVVSYGSKRAEAWVKLYNDAFAPISNRVSVAAEKISKAA